MRIILFLGIMTLLLFGCFENPKRDRYVIPEGFHGTVYVYYQVAGAPVLPMEDGYRLIIVPPMGIVKTSSDMMPGKLHDEFLQVTGQGRKPFPPERLGGGGTVQNENTGEIFSWFIVQ